MIGVIEYIKKVRDCGKQWWVEHGTKILGVFTVLVALLGESLHDLQLWDKDRAALWGLMFVIGAFIVKRGFTNSKSPPPPPPPQS